MTGSDSVWPLDMESSPGILSGRIIAFTKKGMQIK